MHFTFRGLPQRSAPRAQYAYAAPGGDPLGEFPSGWIGTVYPCPGPACSADGGPCGEWHGVTGSLDLPGRRAHHTCGHADAASAARALHERREIWAAGDPPGGTGAGGATA